MWRFELKSRRRGLVPSLTTEVLLGSLCEVFGPYAQAFIQTYPQYYMYAADDNHALTN